MTNRTYQALQVLIDQAIGTDQFLYFHNAATVGNQFGCCGHVDSVDVGIANRWRCRCEIHFSGTRFPRQFDDLLRCRSAHDRVIDQQYILAAKLEVYRVQLVANRLRALCLPRHDKRAADVAILDKAFAILDAKVVGHLQRGRAARVRNRNNHIDVVVREVTHNFAGQLFTHAQSCLIDRQIIENGIGTREINVFEYARCVAHRAGIIAAMECSIVFDIDTLAGSHVPYARELQDIKRHALGRDYVVLAVSRRALTQNQRPNAVSIAKGNDAEADDERDNCVPAPATTMHRVDGVKYIFGRWAAIDTRLQLVCEHIEEYFRIGIGTQMTPVVANQKLSEFLIVRQIAIVRQTNAVG